jgi:SAM-dependent methyltransferase
MNIFFCNKKAPTSYICSNFGADMSKLPWYKDWFNSPYYHLLYFERNEKEAAAFIEKLLARLQPVPGSKMLDVACGKGRHAKVLADKGFDVTGIDISPDMIAEAKKLENENLQFFLHDMRLPFWINYYHYAFNFFTSFGYFNTRRDHDDAIRTIANALRPGGTLVIDYLNVHYVENHLVHQDHKSIDGIDFYLTRWLDEESFFKKIEIEDEKLDEPLVFTEKVHKFTLGDFTDMLAYQGLQITEVFGDYQLSPYHLFQSPRAIMIARKIR